MRNASIVLSMIAVLMCISPLAADAGMVYETGDLSINRWHVHLSSHAFEAESAQPGYLEIRKNTPGLPIQMGFLRLNRRWISLKHFLEGSDPTLRKTITLRQHNRLRVLLVGSPGASITITIGTDKESPPPVVDFSATPETINAGSTSTLAWSCLYADACTIEPDIGAVDAAGSITVSPETDITYTFTATGPGGTATASATVVVRSPMRIEIASPVDGDTIDRPDVMVQGTFTNETGTETGITVNGQVAMVYGNRFVVNHLSLEEGLNTITATAMDINGNTQTAEATIYAAIPEHYISLSANIESGSAPQSMTLSATGTFSIQDAIFSHTGINPDELVELTPDEYQATFTEEGIALITAEATHAATTYRDTIGIVIVDRSQVDALLQQKWADMKVHLAAKDVTEAVRWFDDGKKGLYEEVFSALLDRLPQIAGDMQDISLISIDGQSARYRIRRVETHNTGTFSVTYYVYFIKDETGIWKIYRF